MQSALPVMVRKGTLQIRSRSPGPTSGGPGSCEGPALGSRAAAHQEHQENLFFVPLPGSPQATKPELSMGQTDLLSYYPLSRYLGTHSRENSSGAAGLNLDCMRIIWKLRIPNAEALLSPTDSGFQCAVQVLVVSKSIPAYSQSRKFWIRALWAPL